MNKDPNWNLDFLKKDEPPIISISKVNFLTTIKLPKKIDKTAVYNINGYVLSENVFYAGRIHTIFCEACNTEFKSLLPLSRIEKGPWFKNKEFICPSCDSKLTPTKGLEDDIESCATKYELKSIKEDVKYEKLGTGGGWDTHAKHWSRNFFGGGF
jgi:hypothetical protein